MNTLLFLKRPQQNFMVFWIVLLASISWMSFIYPCICTCMCSSEPYVKNLLKDFLQKSKRCRDRGWSYWLTKFTYKEWKYYWLTKCINKNHNVWLYISHMQPSLGIVAVAWQMPHYFTATYVACVKRIATRRGSCLCTLSWSASNTSIPCSYVNFVSQ